MDDFIRQLMIADGDRLALERPRFRIAEQIGARRRQILLRLAPEVRALSEARGAIPVRKVFQPLIERGQRLMRRAGELRTRVITTKQLGDLFELAQQVDTFADTVTDYVADVERELRVASKPRFGRVVVGAVIVAAGIAALLLLRKRRELALLVSTLQRRLAELPGRLTGLSRAKRVRGGVQRVTKQAATLQDELGRRTSILSLGKLGARVAKLRTATKSIEREVAEFVANRRAIAEKIGQDRADRKEQARDRIFKRKRETPLQRPPLYFYVTARDERVRSNHVPFDGFVLTRDAFLARNIAPPNGFNCRCVIVKIDKPRSDALYDAQAERLGSEEKAIAFFENRPIPRGAFRDAGFK